MNNKYQISRVFCSMSVFIALLLTTQAYAYSYSEAGKEPLIEGREALIGALLANDQKEAEQALVLMHGELSQLEGSMSIALIKPLKEAVSKGQRGATIKLMNKTFAAEIKHRLNQAEANINDYQKSKILVAKSKLFLGTIIVELDDDEAELAQEAINTCLKALGNPGVFGAGKEPVNLEQFKVEKKVLFESLQTFE